MEAHSIKGGSPQQIQNKINNLKKEGFQPTLAFVFVTEHQDWNAVRDLLHSDGIQIFGATTDTQYTNEGVHKDGIALLLLELDTHYFDVFITDIEPQHASEAGNQIAESGLKSFTNPAFIISAAHIEMPFEIIIEGIVKKAGKDIMLTGGIAGSSRTFEGTIFTNDKHTNKGMITLVLDRDKVEIAGLAVSGWKPVGTEKTITKSEGPWIHTIDGTPAMEVLQKYIGDELYDESSKENIVRLNTSYPLQVKRPAGSPIMRPTLLLNVEEKSVLCGGTISKGEQFRFSLPPDFDVIESVVESSKSIKATEMPEADALLVFSCIGRLESLGPMIDTELEGLTETWGKPMAGFFSLGEFGCVEGGIPEFHGTTCSWVALKEK